MSVDWLPVLVVLAVGSLAGLAMAWWMRRVRRSGGESSGGSTDASTGEGSESADVALRLEDLERRKRELYEQLEREEEAADRQLLEDQAARVLREIDRLRGQLPAETVATRQASSATEGTGPTASPGRQMLVGFLGGAAMVSLVGLLIFWAGRDAKPRDAMEASAPMAPRGEEHPAVAMTADAAARISGLRERLEANPSDLVARKQLALALLTAEQYVEAFEVAQEIVASRPNDPDGLYVLGMVRMTMGQDDIALELLDRVLEQFPNHVLALAGRGMIFLRGGDREAAILVWERALEAAGGRHPDLEGLLEMARNAPAGGSAPGAPPTSPAAFGAESGGTDEGGTDEGGPGEVGSGEAGPATPGPAPVDAAAVAGFGAAVPPGHFAVELDIATGATVPPGATLFVFLREAEQGPPAAVRRVQSPVFPLRIELGPQDSMLGRPLPDAGMITARLDADGSASTQSPGDLAAEGAARVGEAVRLSLGG